MQCNNSLTTAHSCDLMPQKSTGSFDPKMQQDPCLGVTNLHCEDCMLPKHCVF